MTQLTEPTVDLAATPAAGQLRQAIAELSLISHVSGRDYEGKIAKDTTESKGGGRPPGDDYEPRPHAPKHPGPDTPENELSAYLEKKRAFDDELAAWNACYQRKTPAWFRHQVAACRTEAELQTLADEAVWVVAAWKRAPLPSVEPTFGSPQWKRFIGESREDSGRLATRFNCTRRYINQIRKQYGPEPAKKAA